MLGKLRAFLSSKSSRLLGWFSYSLYLIHFMIISGSNSMAIEFQLSPAVRTFVVLILAPLLSLFFAFGFAWLFEYRFSPKGQRAPTLPV